MQCILSAASPRQRLCYFLQRYACNVKKATAILRCIMRTFTIVTQRYHLRLLPSFHKSIPPPPPSVTQLLNDLVFRSKNLQFSYVTQISTRKLNFSMLIHKKQVFLSKSFVFQSNALNSHVFIQSVNLKVDGKNTFPVSLYRTSLYLSGLIRGEFQDCHKTLELSF